MHDLSFFSLANDDVVSPTALVGKKIAPIMVRYNKQCKLVDGINATSVVEALISFQPNC